MNQREDQDPGLRTTPAQRRSLETIDTILDAAERLIAEAGQVSFTAAELATSAGTSIGRVYYWFADLPTIVNAVRARILTTLHDPTMWAGDPVQGFCRIIEIHPATAILAVTGPPADRAAIEQALAAHFGNTARAAAGILIDYHRVDETTRSMLRESAAAATD